MSAAPPPFASHPRGEEPRAARRPGLWAHLGLAAVLALAAWARLTGFRAAFPGGVAMGIDGDCDYHVRRILAALHGSIPTFDPLMNWPAGGHAPWADGFDLLGAAFAWLVGGGRSADVAMVALLAWPVVVGILTVWATVDLTRALVPRGDEATPLAAGLVAAVIPQFVAISTYGRVDHHIAEALSMVLLAVWAVRRFSRRGGDAEGEAPGARWEVAGALAVAASLWLFSGGVLYVGIAAVPLGLAVVAARRIPRLVGSGAPAMRGGAAVGALLTVPAIRGHGRLFSFMFPSLLQPTLVVLAGVAVGAAALAGRKLGERHRARRLAAALGALGATAALAWLLLPALRSEVTSAVRGWLLAQDPWLADVMEFQPLLSPRGPGGGGLRSVRYHFGAAGLLGAAAFPIALAVGARAAAIARAAVYAWVSVALAGLTLLQLRFGRVVAPFIAVAIALALLAGARLLGRFLPWPRLLGAAPLLAAATVVLASPTLRRQLAVFDPPDLDGLRHAATDLRIDRPPRPGARDGVLVPWDYGHTLSTLSGRPVVANGFGSYLDAASFADVKAAFLGDEARLVATMDRYDLGWLVAGGSILASQPQPQGVPPAIGNPGVLNPEYMLRMPLSQLLIAGSGLPAPGLPHLERLMPVFASRSVAGQLGFPLPVVWTYERVAGAVLRGRAAPGTPVVAEIQLVEWGRPHRYRAWADAGADGTWRIRVALPSRFHRPTLRSGPAWTVDLGERKVDVEVPEEAVRAGREIAVPSPARG